MEPVISVIVTSVTSAVANAVLTPDLIGKILLNEPIEKLYNVIMTSNAGGSVSSEPVSSVEGGLINISAIADIDNRFVRWEIVSNNIVILDMNDSNQTFTMPAENVEINAVFEVIPVNARILNFDIIGGIGTISATVDSSLITSGSYINIGDTVIFTATPGIRNRVLAWTNNTTIVNGTNNIYSLVVTDNHSITLEFEPVPLYLVTVENGSGTDSFAEGEIVTITANPPEPKHIFKNWTIIGDGVTLSDPNSVIATFIMPPNTVTLVATYEELPPEIYAVTVFSEGIGSSGSGSYPEGNIVEIIAGNKDGYRFIKWTSAIPIIFEDVSSNKTSFIMPENNIEVTAIFVKLYKVTVENGVGGGEFAPNDKVTLTANDAPVAKQFKEWIVVPDVTLVSNTELTFRTIEFTMPSSSVSAIGTYELLPEEHFPVTVSSDGGNGIVNVSVVSASPGTTVTIIAIADSGYYFKEWSVIEGGFELSKSNPNSFTMPHGPVNIIGTFEEIPTNVIYPKVSVYIHDLDEMYDAHPSGILPGVYVVENIIIPVNDGDEDLVFTFEVYSNGNPTGITAPLTIYRQDGTYIEVSNMVIYPNKLGPKGGSVSVRIEFTLPTKP